MISNQQSLHFHHFSIDLVYIYTDPESTLLVINNSGSNRLLDRELFENEKESIQRKRLQFIGKHLDLGEICHQHNGTHAQKLKLYLSFGH